MTRYSDATEIQKRLARQVVERDDYAEIENICAVDVAYDDKNAYCSAVMMSMSGQHIESANSKSAIESPYLPGFLMLRESPPIFRTLKMLKHNFDLLLVDGHGQLHPRKCGIACYLGLTLDKPTIGIAKSLLCGTLENDRSIRLDGKILGKIVGEGRKKIYVSVGHRISLQTAENLVRDLGKGAMPEAMKQADANSKKEKRLTRF
jgi:deoxyribonuclease V